MAPPQDVSALKRLADLVIKRRSELGMHKVDVARAAKMQVNTYSKVEDGQPARSTTYARIEPILGWATGSCMDILSGAAAPTLIEGTPSGAVISPVRAEDLAQDVGKIVQDAAIAISDSLTSAEIRALKQRVVDELLAHWEKRGLDHD